MSSTSLSEIEREEQADAWRWTLMIINWRRHINRLGIPVGTMTLLKSGVVPRVIIGVISLRGAAAIIRDMTPVIVFVAKYRHHA
ncbi:MAG: hypothetical protein ACYC9L_12005 [Sulfuricaulis sp.]